MTAPLVVHDTFIVKTGLDAFDAARAWGWAVVLNVLTEDAVFIDDETWRFRVQPCTSLVSPRHALWDNLAGRTLFSDENWRYVFVAQKGGWQKHVAKVRLILQQRHGNLLQSLQNASGSPFGEGERLPVGVDPGGSGGLSVLEDHWALACLGMSACGTYASASATGPSSRLAILPVPHHVRMSYFLDRDDLFRMSSLRYHSTQHAAAHYAVQLAERLRRRSADQGELRDRYSAILSFSIFGSRQQTAPTQINHLDLDPLMNAIQHAHRSQRMFRWLDNCFRLGAEEGAEDLALATAKLVMRWDVESYQRLVYSVTCHQSQGRMKHLLEGDTVEEIIRHVRTR